MNEYEPNINLNSKILSLNKTISKSNDSMTCLLQMLQEQKACKILDNLYFARSCITLAKEAIDELKEEYSNKESEKVTITIDEDVKTNKWEHVTNDEIKPTEVTKVISDDPWIRLQQKRYEHTIYTSDNSKRKQVIRYQKPSKKN